MINYFFMVAEQLREIMAQMGFRTVNEMVGRVDRLDSKKAIDHWKAKGLDFSQLLHRPEASDRVATYCCETQDHGLDEALDQELLRLAESALHGNGPVEATLPSITTTERWAPCSAERWQSVTERRVCLKEAYISACRVPAGQSFGAFLAKGVALTLEGDANDYFGKGMSGGRLVVYAPEGSTFVAEDNVIIGNVALYGATGGRAFIRGMAGERFAVRNSAAYAVVEGIGDHGCEYMTGGSW